METKVETPNKGKWLDDKITEVKHYKGYYKLLCVIFMRKTLTYRQYFYFIYNLNKKKYGNDDAIKIAYSHIRQIYFENNNSYPEKTQKSII